MGRPKAWAVPCCRIRVGLCHAYDWLFGCCVETSKQRFLLAEDRACFVRPGLYLGSWDTECDWYALKDLGITHVLQVGLELSGTFPDKLCYKKLQIRDSAEEDVVQLLPGCFQFIEEGRQAGGVLVHCAAGVSRSATVVIAYLMWKEGITLQQSLWGVKAARHWIQPNKGFMMQLRLLEYIGCDFEKWPGWRFQQGQPTAQLQTPTASKLLHERADMHTNTTQSNVPGSRSYTLRGSPAQNGLMQSDASTHIPNPRSSSPAVTLEEPLQQDLPQAVQSAPQHHLGNLRKRFTGCLQGLGVNGRQSLEVAAGMPPQQDPPQATPVSRPTTPQSQASTVSRPTTPQHHVGNLRKLLHGHGSADRETQETIAMVRSNSGSDEYIDSTSYARDSDMAVAQTSTSEHPHASSTHSAAQRSQHCSTSEHLHAGSAQTIGVHTDHNREHDPAAPTTPVPCVQSTGRLASSHPMIGRSPSSVALLAGAQPALA